LIDISKELILQLNKNNNEYKDVTEKVDWYEQSGKSYTVKYNTSETIYHQSFANWIVLNNPISIEIKNKLIFIEGNLAENVVSVLAFENWYKIFYANGYANAYFLDKITISDDITSLPEINTMIEYLKEISRFLSVDESIEGEQMRNNIVNWLKKYDIPYQNIYFSSDKVVEIQKLHLDILIEDSPKYIPLYTKYVHVLCYDCRYNREIECQNMTRVFSWYDIYDKIKKGRK